MNALLLDASSTKAVSGGATPAEQAVATAAAAVEPIGLDELIELAELQTRVDRKYFVPAGVFQRLIAELGGELRVLDIEGRRSFGYESVYFDTPQLSTYRAHVQRRRQRFKARTRTYTDTGQTMFEVKLAGPRGETVKQRLPSPTRRWPTWAPRCARPTTRTCRPGCGRRWSPPTGAPRSSPAPVRPG